MHNTRGLVIKAYNRLTGGITRNPAKLFEGDNKIKLLADATLPQIKTAFPAFFEISLYNHSQNLEEALQGQDILLCRSTLKITPAFLKDCRLKIIATASSGVDHIDASALRKENITLIDAKGCNAASVADYILSTLAWLKIEKGFQGSKLGLIGMGEVGSLVAERLKILPFTLFCFDPLVKKWQHQTLEALKDCDLISIHANLHENPPFPSKNLLNADFFAKLKPHAVIVNAARGEIVDETALLSAREDIVYCTDVYKNEPDIHAALVQRATLATPHIAGHSIEAKNLAVQLVSQKIHQAFGLPEPVFEVESEKSNPIDLTKSNWPSKILKLYNPFHETRALQSATDKKKAFVELRKAHIRHTFKIITPG